MYIKKRFYRNVESIIKKFIVFSKKNSKNVDLQKSIQSAIYNTSDKEKILFLNKNKQKFLVHANDGVSKKLFIDFEFDFKIFRRALKLINKSHKRKTIVNIGANIGSICVKAVKENFFESAIVFEPEIMNFRLLMANIYINELDKKIEAYQLALSDKKKILKLSLNKESNLGDNRIVTNKIKEKNLKIVKVKSDLLDNYTSNLNKHNTLIFMDVQGHEPNVFKGAKKTIKKRMPMVFEFMPSLLPKNWIEGFELLFKNYNFFYNLHNRNKKEKFNKNNIEALFNNINSKKDAYTDLLII